MHRERHGDNAIGHEYAEVFAQLGVVEELLAGLRGHDEQRVKEDHAQNGLLVGGLLHARTAHQQGRNGELPHLGMRAVRGEGADVLQVDQLTPAGQQGFLLKF